MHFLLFYEFSSDYLPRRAEFRNQHLQFAWEAVERGEILLAGALADPVDTGVLLFETESDETVRAFAAADPYVTQGLVKNWEVRRWTTVVGEAASTPLLRA